MIASSEDDWDRYETLHWRRRRGVARGAPGRSGRRRDPQRGTSGASARTCATAASTSAGRSSSAGSTAGCRSWHTPTSRPSRPTSITRTSASSDMREALLRIARGAAATDVAAEAIEAWATGGSRTYEEAEHGLCFGRLDLDAVGGPALRRPALGRRRRRRRSSSTGRRRPRGRSTRRRRPSRTASRSAAASGSQGRTLTGISDEALDGSLADAAAPRRRLPARGARARARRAHARHRRDDPGRPVRADRARTRSRRSSSRAARARGRPPSGCTARRISSTRTATTLRRVLVVGPNPVFMDYVSHVLPALGEDSVDQRAVAELVDGVDGHGSRPARRRAAEGRPAARRGRAPRGRAPLAGQPAGARRPARGHVRRRARRTRSRSCCAEARARARGLGGGARAVPDERAAALLRRLRRDGSAASPCARSTRSSGALRKDGRAEPASSTASGPRRGPSRSCASCSRRASGSPRRPTGSSTPTSRLLLRRAQERLERRRPAAPRRGERAAPGRRDALRARHRRRGART